MADFYDISASGLSIEECDRIALEDAGCVRSTAYSYARPRGGDVNEEYSSKVINTQGMGNHGTIILVGKTPRARKLLRQGKINWLVQHGISQKIAKVAVSMQYGMELGVAELAEDILPLIERGFSYKGNSHYKFDKWCGFESDLTYPRKMAALAIAKRAAKAKK